MKNVQISEELFLTLVKYHLLDIEDMLSEIKRGLTDKMEQRRDCLSEEIHLFRCQS